MRIGYLGPEGTFSEEAARTSEVAEAAEFEGLPSIHAAIMAVMAGDVDRAVVPIENSVEGPVGVTLDTLTAEASALRIVGEVVLAVTQCLVARRPLPLDAVERVSSHPQALSQCAVYVREQLPGAQVVATPSTAGAVREVVGSDRPWAALSSRRAATLHGATVLAEGVEDEPGNATRFVWLARQAPSEPVAGPHKTSLAFWGPGDDSPGWLVRCLSEFAFRGVNLTKIESRPLRGRLGRYRFFVDLEGAAGDDAVIAALEGLRGLCDEVRTLGSYPTRPSTAESPKSPD